MPTRPVKRSWSCWQLSALGRSIPWVFAGFGESAFGDRIQASGSRLVFVADITFRKRKDGTRP
ncbi:hypothetical protein [Candidatus Villigracilis affinis]|uniref:hypothetical protein n=1 Tax=Candidatus Villigracilis affinis TaxID=3140682 RepID=UPI001D46CA25|nr:hypothetical protein [Anaerolineales bacterium]